MTSKGSLCLLALVLAAPAVRADPIYVIEQLVVSVTSDPGADAERIAQVKSGDKLELIERQADEAHVRLPNGKDGWIKSSYLTTDPPLQTRLTERTAEVEKLKQEQDKLKQDGEKLRQDVSRLQSELAATRVAPKAAAATADSPPPAPIRETVFLRSPDRPGQTSWPFLLGISAVMLLVGFVLGWKTLDRRIRQKYGGLRIY
jgi:SH3 domain protein